MNKKDNFNVALNVLFLFLFFSSSSSSSTFLELQAGILYSQWRENSETQYRMSDLGVGYCGLYA